MFDLKVGFTCNNDCIHCVVGAKRDTEDLSLEEIKKIIDQIPQEEGIQLTGGEISIRKDFLDILKYCKQKNLRVCVQTNGTGFANDTIAFEASKYIDYILIAIHSADETIHNTIVGHCKDAKSMYSLTMKGLDNIIKYKIPFQTQTVVSTLNIASLYELYSFIQKKVPGTLMHLTYPHPMGNAEKNWELVVPKYSSIKKYITPLVRDFGQLLIIEAIPPCYLYPYYLNIEVLTDSEIKQNRVSRLGFDKSNGTNKLFKEGFTENYNNNDIVSKLKGPKCKECFYDKECAGVWKEYFNFYKKSLDLYPIKDVDDNSVDTIHIKANTIEDIPLSLEDVPSYKRIVLDIDYINGTTVDSLHEINTSENFYLLNIKNSKKAFEGDLFSKSLKYYLFIDTEEDIELLHTILSHKNASYEESYLYVDISLLLGTDKILDCLYTLDYLFEDFKNIFVRLQLNKNYLNLESENLAENSFEEESYTQVTNALRYLSGIFLKFSYIICFVNVPNCVLGNCNLDTYQRFPIINNLLSYTFMYEDKKLISKESSSITVGYSDYCECCELKNRCLGFNSNYPLDL